MDIFVPDKIRVGKQFRFGFVRFTKREEVEKAISRNNELLIKGRSIRV